MRFAFASALAFAVLPVIILACGDDAGGSAPVADGGAQPDGALPDSASQPEAASLPKITVNVEADGYVVFYPRTSLDQPVVERASHGQTLVKEMPAGAHLLFASAGTDSDGVHNGSVVEVDDVEAGETIRLPGAPVRPLETTPDPRHVKGTMPSFGDDGTLVYRLRTCSAVGTGGVGNRTFDYDQACVEDGDKLRVLGTVVNTNDEPVAISGALVDITPDPAGDGTPSIQVPQWTTPTPTTWSFTGAVPQGAKSQSADVAVTNRTTSKGIPLYSTTAGTPVDSVSFLRPPAGFNDGETHYVSMEFFVAEGASASSSILDRTAASATVTTDRTELGVHFTNASVSATESGAFDFAYKASTAFPQGTVFYISADGTSSAGGVETKLQWLKISSKIEGEHLSGLVLPEAVRQAVIGTSAIWTLDVVGSVAGVDARELRANPVGGYLSSNFSSADVDLGLPVGAFKLNRSSYSPAKP